MREFAAVWKWTVEEKKGVFSPTPPRTTKLRQRPPPIPVKQHSLLIKVNSVSTNLYLHCTKSHDHTVVIVVVH